MLRLSGERALEVAGRVFRSLHGKRSLAEAPDRTLLHGVVVDPGSGEKLDEVLVAAFRGPHSYTGEDVVEIFGHGGQFVLRRVMAALQAAGARAAGPGEFTYRAFLNGRLDLASAEAVVDVVRARSEEGLRCAVDGLLGALSRRVGLLRDDLLAVLAHLEAALDFPDEEIPPVAWPEVDGRLTAVKREVRRLLAGAGQGRLYREGLRVVLIGRPNVGKSSLLNALLGQERAIVTGVPGTTRDVLEENTVLAGVPVCLVDTAGLRSARDAVEEEGVRRARLAARGGHVGLWVVDGSVPLQDEDREAARELRAHLSLVVVNKADRGRIVTGSEVEELLPGRRQIEVSARTGKGLKRLGEAIVEEGRAALGGGGGASLEGRQDAVVTHARHEAALRRAEQELAAALREGGRGAGEELVAARLRAALDALGEISGESVDDEVLREIFATFCIGK